MFAGPCLTFQKMLRVVLSEHAWNGDDLPGTFKNLLAFPVVIDKFFDYPIRDQVPFMSLIPACSPGPLSRASASSLTEWVKVS